MRPLLTRAFSLVLCLAIVSCASRPLPPYEPPLARTQYQRVRTTAYTDTESDHIRYSNHNALGGTLQYGDIHSAAADWSRWPAGTVFRIRETGELYQVDDYGWALSGTNTIDLYKPSRQLMNAWGTRGVTIENLQWGDPKQSLAVLRQRSHYRHVRRMIKEMEERMAILEKPVPAMGTPPSPVLVADGPSPVVSAAPVSSYPSNSYPPPQSYPTTSSGAQPAPRAVPVAATRPGSVTRDPFFNNSGTLPRQGGFHPSQDY